MDFHIDIINRDGIVNYIFQGVTGRNVQIIKYEYFSPEDVFTVNSDIFARVLFHIAMFRDNKFLAKCRNHSVLYRCM